MPEDHQHKDTPKDAILAALAECEVGEEPITEIVIIYGRKSGGNGSYDSGLTIAEAGWLCQLYINWLASVSIGAVVGRVKRELFEHVGFQEPKEPDDEPE